MAFDKKEHKFTVGWIGQYTETGVEEDWGVGLQDDGMTNTKSWIKMDDGIILAEAGFDPSKVVNKTCTLVEITDSDALAAAKTKWNVA